MSTTHNPKHRCLSVTHESVNFSPTKQKYSFSKGSRFKSLSGPTNCELNHTLPGTFGRRSPSFGIGDRFKILKKPRKSIILFQPNLRISLHYYVTHPKIKTCQEKSFDIKHQKLIREVSFKSSESYLPLFPH